MPEPDCFLWYRIIAPTRNFITSGKSQVYVLARPAAAARRGFKMVLFTQPSKHLCRRYMRSAECPSSCLFIALWYCWMATKRAPSLKISFQNPLWDYKKNLTNRKPKAKRSKRVFATAVVEAKVPMHLNACNAVVLAAMSRRCISYRRCHLSEAKYLRFPASRWSVGRHSDLSSIRRAGVREFIQRDTCLMP